MPCRTSLLAAPLERPPALNPAPPHLPDFLSIDPKRVFPTTAAAEASFNFLFDFNTAANQASWYVP